MYHHIWYPKYINILFHTNQLTNIIIFLYSFKVGASVIHDAAVKGKLNVIEWMIKHTDINTSFKDADGATIIHLASKFDHTNIVEWLLSREGTKLAKYQTFNGASCLHFACANNSFNTLKLLVHAAPSFVNVQMNNGVTPVYLGTI